MAISRLSEPDFYKGLIEAFSPGALQWRNSGAVSDAEKFALAQRMGIPVEQIFDMESGQNAYRYNFNDFGQQQMFNDAVSYGDTWENLYNKYVPQNFRDSLIDARTSSPYRTGANFELYGPDGQRAFHNDLLDQYGVFLPESVAGQYSQLGLRPAINKEAAGLLQGDNLGIGELAPLAILGMWGGAGLSALGGAGGAAGLAPMEAGVGSSVADLAGMGGAASAGGTAAALPDIGAENFFGFQGTPGVGDAGAFDQFGALSYPGGAGSGTGAGTIYANAATPNAIESALGLPAGSLGGGNASGGGTAAAGSALGRVLDGTASTSDWLSILGTAGATGLGILGSREQADTIRGLAEQSRADRAPFLSAATGYLTNPTSWAEGPGAALLDANLRKLSVGGNPIGDPAKLGIATGAAMQNWLGGVTGLGNLGLSGEDTRAQLGLAGAQADANVWNSLGYGLGQVTNPQKSFEDMLKGFKFGSLGSGRGLGLV